jgi:hypothetical protein
MKHIRSFNELNKSTYLSAADKLNKLGGTHADRAKALKIHARDRETEYDVHNLYYHEFKIFYKQLGFSERYKYKGMMLNDFDLYTIVDVKIKDPGNDFRYREYNAKYDKSILVNLQSSKTNDKISIELGIKEDKKSKSRILDNDDEIFNIGGDRLPGDDEDFNDIERIYDMDDEDLDDEDLDKYYDTGETDGEVDEDDENTKKKKKNKFFFWKKENNMYKDYIGEINEAEEEAEYEEDVKNGDLFLYIRHIDDSPNNDNEYYGDDGNTFNNNFKFSLRKDALEFKRFLMDWYKRDNSEFISEIKRIAVNKLYE